MGLFSKPKPLEIGGPELVGKNQYMGGNPMTNSPIGKIKVLADAKCPGMASPSTPTSQKLDAVFAAFIEYFQTNGWRYAATSDKTEEIMIMMGDARAETVFEATGRPANCLKICKMLKLAFEMIVVPTMAEYKTLTQQQKQPITAAMGDKSDPGFAYMNNASITSRMAKAYAFSVDPVLKAKVVQIDELFLTKELGNPGVVSSGKFACIDTRVVGNVMRPGGSFAATKRCLFSMHAAIEIAGTVYDACLQSKYAVRGSSPFEAIIDYRLKKSLEKGPHALLVGKTSAGSMVQFVQNDRLPPAAGFLNRYEWVDSLNKFAKDKMFG